ncbi:MAG: hypothetical protein OXJ37_05795 [Bryobacterales bacterium]|nr:hypothetical protein [Bryobacterales bacterium]MDE0622236.1 hypothetical protein [Bryobacterales bacterium]
MGLRNILLLVVGVIGLAIVRNLIREISRIMLRSAKRAASGPAAQKGDSDGKTSGGGKLVRDPQTGTYIDPAHAVRTKVGKTVHYFESEASRDAFLKANA